MGFITRTIGRRIEKRLDQWANTPEGQEAMEHSHRLMELDKVVKQMAGSDLDDESACAKLRQQLVEDRDLIVAEIKSLRDSRTSYVDDRAYRLLTAATDGTPVRSIDPTMIEQFSAERQLGRLPLSDAFAYLVSLEPRLTDESARRYEESDQAKQGNKSGTRSSDPWLVGFGAAHPQPLLNTDLAAEVVREYTAVTRGGRVVDDDSTPYFERQKRTFGGSFVFGESRPRANN